MMAAEQGRERLAKRGSRAATEERRVRSGAFLGSTSYLSLGDFAFPPSLLSHKDSQILYVTPRGMRKATTEENGPDTAAEKNGRACLQHS